MCDTAGIRRERPGTSTLAVQPQTRLLVALSQPSGETVPVLLPSFSLVDLSLDTAHNHIISPRRFCSIRPLCLCNYPKKQIPSSLTSINYPTAATKCSRGKPGEKGGQRSLSLSLWSWGLLLCTSNKCPQPNTMVACVPPPNVSH